MIQEQERIDLLDLRTGQRPVGAEVADVVALRGMLELPSAISHESGSLSHGCTESSRRERIHTEERSNGGRNGGSRWRARCAGWIE